MIPNRFSNFFAAVIAAILLVGAKLEAADLSRARVRDNIVYFLEPSPAQLKRYDMAAQAWLAPLPAPAGATCFDIDTNGIYFGTGQAIVRIDPGGGAPATLTSVTAPVEDLLVAGSKLVFLQNPVTVNGSRHVLTADKGDGLLIDVLPFDGTAGRISLGPDLKTFWVQGVNWLDKFSLQDDGTLAVGGVRSLPSNASPAPVLVSPDGSRLFLEDTTGLSAADLSTISVLGGNLRRLALNGPAFVAARGSNVVAFSRGAYETGRMPVPFAPEYLRIHGTNVFAFAAGLSDVAVLPIVQLGGLNPAGPLEMSRMNLEPVAMVSDGQGEIFMIDLRFPSVFVWSGTNGTYLLEIALGGIPRVLAFDRPGKRLLVGLASGTIQQIDLGLPTRAATAFAAVQGRLNDLIVIDGPVIASVDQPVPRTSVFNSVGVAVTNLYGAGMPTTFAWDGVRRQLWRRVSSANSFERTYVPVSGALNDNWSFFSFPTPNDLPTPTTLAPDGSRLLGLGGAVINTTNNGQTAGFLGVATTSAAWTTQGLHTLRPVAGYVEIQRWNEAFQNTATGLIEGQPFGIFPHGTNLLVVSRVGFDLQFSRWTPGLTKLGASAVALAPTNVVFSGVLTNGIQYGTAFGSLRIEPDLGNGEPGFAVVSVSSEAPIQATGTNLVFAGGQFQPGSTNPVQITITATNQRGRVITATVSVPVLFRPPDRPVVTLERLSPIHDVLPDQSAQMRIRITPGSTSGFQVRFKVSGDAVGYTDYFFDYLFTPPYQVPPFETSINIGPGETEKLLTISSGLNPAANGFRFVTLKLDEDAAYQVGTTNAETVLIWPSAYAAFFGNRFGASNSTNAVAAPDADFDGNGVSNYAEYLFAARMGVPKVAMQQMREADGELRLAVVFRRSVPVRGQFDILVSTNLENWSPAAFRETTEASPESDSETVTWTLPVAGRPRLFARVRGAAYGQLRLPDFRVSGADIGFVGVPQVGIQLGSETYESGALPDERPRFVSSFGKSFWVSKREINQAEFAALMTNNPSVNVGTNFPVENVTWTEATEFCRRLTAREAAAGRLPDGYVFRLPTEAEWEYSARGGVSYFSWGSIDRTNLTVSAWFAPNSFYVTHPVGRLPPNAYGLQDMLGNVAEWCADWYGPYPTGTVIDRVGPLFGTQRVIRGGNVLDSETGIRAAARSSAPPEFRSRLVGFRVVLARPVQ